MKKAVYILVNLVCLLLVLLVWCYGEIGYLESKVNYFDQLAEEYREIVHKQTPYAHFPFYTLYAKGEKPKYVLPDFE